MNHRQELVLTIGGAVLFCVGVIALLAWVDSGADETRSKRKIEQERSAIWPDRCEVAEKFNACLLKMGGESASDKVVEACMSSAKTLARKLPKIEAETKKCSVL